MFGGIFHDHLLGSWEEARGYLIEELSQLRTALNAKWDQVFNADGTLSADSISGITPAVPRYVANTGDSGLPKWDTISLGSTGVSGRLPFTHLPEVLPSHLVGRVQGGGTGDMAAITLGTGLSMTGNVLNAAAGSSSVDYVVMSDGAAPPTPMNDGVGNFLYVGYTP